MPCRAGTTAWQFQTAAHGQTALRSGYDEHIRSGLYPNKRTMK